MWRCFERSGNGLGTFNREPQEHSKEYDRNILTRLNLTSYYILGVPCFFWSPITAPSEQKRARKPQADMLQEGELFESTRAL